MKNIEPGKNNKLKQLGAFAALLVVAALFLPLLAGAAALVNDTFADGNSQNQDLANNSIRLFNGRAGTVRTDGSARSILTPPTPAAPKASGDFSPTARRSISASATA